MRYVKKTKTWQDHFNDILRYIIFPDEELRELMLIPEGTNIVKWFEKYFMRDVSSDELLTNEKVRVAFSDEQGTYTNNQHVRIKYKSFDIYVSEDVEHTASDDYLQSRQALIAQRIKELLLKHKVQYQLHFEYEDEYDLWTKLIGYKAYRITFSYKTST